MTKGRRKRDEPRRNCFGIIAKFAVVAFLSVELNNTRRKR